MRKLMEFLSELWFSIGAPAVLGFASGVGTQLLIGVLR